MRQLWVLLVFLSCFGAAGASELTLQDRTVVSQVDDRSKAAPGVAGRCGPNGCATVGCSGSHVVSELAGKNIAIDEAASASTTKRGIA